jgi:membrane associated rhomboid family serine protease
MQQGYGVHVPKLTYLNKIIIITVASVFFLQNILMLTSQSQIVGYLPLIPVRFFEGHIYELITYPFFAKGVFEVLFECLLLWFVGSDLEAMWGSSRYGKFLAFVVVGGGLFYLLLTWILSMMMGPSVLLSPLMGLAGVTSFLLLAFAILYPNKIFTFMFIFPMKAKHFCALIVGLFFFYGIFRNSYEAFGHLGAMACGYFHMVWLSSPRLQKWRSYFVRDPRKSKKLKGKAKLRLVKKLDDEDDKNGPKYWQ